MCFLFYLNKCKQHPNIKLKDRMKLSKLIMAGKEHLSLFVVTCFEVQSSCGNGFLHYVCKEDERSSEVGTKYMQHNTNAFPFFDVEIICQCGFCSSLSLVGNVSKYWQCLRFFALNCKTGNLSELPTSSISLEVS